MRLSITAKQRLTADLRLYAEEKLQRLERHSSLHDVSLILDRDTRRVPEASAEIIVHIHHTRLAAHCEAQTAREAIDRVVDKADEQIRRRKERVTAHKGRIGAGSDLPRRRGQAPGLPEAEADGVIHERRAKLRPMTVEDAIAELVRREQPYLLFLEEDAGDVAVVAHRPGGGYDLILSDTR